MSYQELLKEFSGKTATKNILNDATKIILENKIHELRTNPRPNCISRVHTESPEKEIINLGGSTPPDLLNNNFLQLLSGISHGRQGVFEFSIPEMINTGGSSITDLRAFDRWNIGNTPPTDDNIMWSTFGGAGVCQIQLGQGIAPVLKTDFNIQTAFGVSPESNRITIGVPAYDTLLNELPLGIGFSAGGTGTISESGLFENYMRIGRTGSLHMIAHDNISPVVPFTFGQAIFAQYVFAL